MNEEDNTENFITGLSDIPYSNLIECLDDHDVDAIVYNKIAEEMYNEFNYILSEGENELIENQNTDLVALGVINSVMNYIDQNEFADESDDQDISIEVKEIADQFIFNNKLKKLISLGVLTKFNLFNAILMFLDMYKDFKKQH